MVRQFDSARERQNAMAERYTASWGLYRGELPVRTRPEDLPARRVMWEAFESMYPSLLAIFTDAKKSPVNFDSDSMISGKVAAAVSKAVHGAALKVNNAYRLYMEGIKEILVTGNKAALVGYDSKTYKTSKFTLDNSPVVELLAMTKAIQTAGYNVEQDLTFSDDEKTVSGTIQGVREIKFPVITMIPFKDFYMHKDAITTDDAIYCAYTENITVAEGTARGYAEDKLKNAQMLDVNGGRGLDTTLLVIGDMNADDLADNTRSVVSKRNNRLTICHHFWRGCYNSKTEKLWRIVTTQKEILQMEEVQYCPLVWGGMSIVPGSAWSESLYDYCRASQYSTTRAMRAIQRVADNAAYPERVVQKGALTPVGQAAYNKRGPGASYEVTRPDAIVNIPAVDLPRAMELLNQELDNQAQKTVQGSAGQAQVLEENANASGTAVALTQNKQELNENQIAKCIAETFIKPIYKILLIVLQEIGGNLDVEGEHIPFHLIRTDLGLSIDIETEYDRAQAATNCLNALISCVKAQILPKNVQQENIYNILADYFRVASGQEDVSRYITPPNQMPKPSPIQEKVKAILAACELRAKIAETALAEGKVEDQKADAQKKYNDAMKDLAEIQQILSEISISKLEFVKSVKESEQQAEDDVTKNAQTQETIDQQG